jgi:nucleotide-binding universal stress UspA family protein
MEPFGRIVVGVDFEAASQRAVDIAIAMSRASGASVTLLHVYALPIAPYAEGLVWPAADFEAAAKRTLEKEIARVAGANAKIAGAVRCGGAADQIVEFVKEQGADLVVMGTHGRKGVSRVLLGSVAERVVRTSPVPVLTIPIPH